MRLTLSIVRALLSIEDDEAGDEAFEALQRLRQVRVLTM